MSELTTSSNPELDEKSIAIAYAAHDAFKLNEGYRPEGMSAETAKSLATELLEAAEEVYDLNPTKFSELSPEEFNRIVGQFGCLKIDYESAKSAESRLAYEYGRKGVNTDDKGDDISWASRFSYEELRWYVSRTRNSTVDRSLRLELEDYHAMHIDRLGAHTLPNRDGVTPKVYQTQYFFRKLKGCTESSLQSAKAELNEFIVLNGDPSAEATQEAVAYFETEEGKRALKNLNYERDQLEEMRRWQDEDAA